MTERALTAWSYSRYDLWAKCPAACAYKHIEKVPEQQSPAMARGQRIHTAVEGYLQAPTRVALPTEGRLFAGLLKELTELGVPMMIEQQWGYTADWRACGWFGPSTWLRIIADIAVVYPDGDSDVIDLKTGKEYETNRDQLELTALGVMRRFPQVERVQTRLWYLDSGAERTAEFLTENSAEMMQKWDDRVRPMFEDRVFAPKPGALCQRCSYAKSRGGVCKFG